MEIKKYNHIEFDYINWKGIAGHRKVKVLGFSYESNEYHPEKQWLLKAYDLEKKEKRIFAIKDMSNVEKM